MAGNYHRWGPKLVLCFSLMTPGVIMAGPLMGDWGLCFHSEEGCPRSEYSPMHYWTPCYYTIRMYVHRANLDHSPPGPSPYVQANITTTKYPCMTAPAMPSDPYANPAAYYSRQVAPK